MYHPQCDFKSSKSDQAIPCALVPAPGAATADPVISPFFWTGTLVGGDNNAHCNFFETKTRVTLEMIRNLATLICLGAVVATSAMAYDQMLIPKVRQLGIAVGKAYVCTPQEHRDYARADFEEMFDTILKIDGHELAFVFAVGIGYGAASDKTGLDCAKLIEKVDAVKAEMGLGAVK